MDSDNLKTKCEEFRVVFEDAILRLQDALKILEVIEAEKRQRYARPTFLGFSQNFFSALNVQGGPNPWTGVRKVDTRLVRLLEAWAGNTLPRAERYVPPDVFGPPPEPEKPEKIEKPKPGLTEKVLGRFFKRPG